MITSRYEILHKAGPLDEEEVEHTQQQAGLHFAPKIVSAYLEMPDLQELWNGDKISQT